MDEAPTAPTCYFIDEAGDGTVFNAKGKVIIGTQGCSRFFMLGLLQVEAPDRIGQELEDLRKEILADPDLASIPSIQPERRKTAIAASAIKTTKTTCTAQMPTPLSELLSDYRRGSVCGWHHHQTYTLPRKG